MLVELVTIVVDEYDPAITFFVDKGVGRVAVFLDIAGNRWDLIGPRPETSYRPI